jgi:hypothetical protein
VRDPEYAGRSRSSGRSRRRNDPSRRARQLLQGPLQAQQSALMTAVVIPAVPMMQMVVRGVFVQPVFWPPDVMYLVLHQVSYYLSDNNLLQDAFLRNRMDSEGWVPIELLASFNRMKAITTDLRLIYEVHGPARSSRPLMPLTHAAPPPASTSQTLSSLVVRRSSCLRSWSCGAAACVGAAAGRAGSVLRRLRPRQCRSLRLSQSPPPLQPRMRMGLV